MKESMRELSEREVSQVSGAGLLANVTQGIVFVGQELAPWSKTGALGDALNELPSSLEKIGEDLGDLVSDLL